MIAEMYHKGLISRIMAVNQPIFREPVLRPVLSRSSVAQWLKQHQSGKAFGLFTILRCVYLSNQRFWRTPKPTRKEESPQQ
jgi:hypothetical protein